ncbi:FixH family protein [Nocardia blacklockiae]|uniref:FixH family protein n=1 Tax=Nocardia blacklockiae TaxID=480036 RepID=UPI002B4B23F8|nr:FixH family protein [Nocardia blacklockiae]
MNKRGVIVLAAVAAVVAGFVAWLVWPTEDSAGQRVSAGPYAVRLASSPHPGTTTVELEVTDRQSAPAQPTRVTVAPAMPQMGHAVPPATAEASGPGRYRATVDLPMPGQWEITVDLSGPAGTGTATFSVSAT